MKKILDSGKLILMKYVNRETISYIICGVLTTIVGLGSFVIAVNLGLGTAIANTVSTVLAVIFAYITNKIIVFQSLSWKLGLLIVEFIKFCGARAATFLAETLLLILLIDMMGFGSTLMKALTTIFVIVANYVFSKFIVFKKQKEE